jgi:hypothetical protein
MLRMMPEQAELAVRSVDQPDQFGGRHLVPLRAVLAVRVCVAITHQAGVEVVALCRRATGCQRRQSSGDLFLFSSASEER